MAKKKLEDLLNNVPSPITRHTKIIIILFAFLIFSIIIYFGSVTYTGLAVIESNKQEPTLINNQNIFLGNQFEVLGIKKLSNSVLSVDIESDNFLNVFAEIDDCSYWKQGQDRDNTILYAINGIKNGNFKIGDPSQKTTQQIDLYKSNNLCLIFINREFPKQGYINIQYKEIEVGLWKIV